MKQGSGLFSNVPTLNRNIRSFRDFIGFILLISVLSLLMPMVLYFFDQLDLDSLLSCGMVADQSEKEIKCPVRQNSGQVS